jgi:hypothetical protein
MIVAAALNGLLAGASLDQSIKQLPARRRIGVIAYAAYSRAGDFGPGVPWYAGLGLGSAVVTIASGVVAQFDGAAAGVAVPLALASVAALAHSAVTARAAPTLFGVRAAAGDEVRLVRIFDRFARLQGLRALLQAVTFGLTLWALAAAVVQ